MKQQKITSFLGFVSCIAQLVSFCDVMADLPVKLRNSVLKTIRKREAEVPLPIQAARADEAATYTDRTKCARVSRESSSGSRSSFQRSFRTTNHKKKHWASKYLRPRRKMPPRSMSLEPISLPTKPEVDFCLSRFAFTIPETPADLKREPIFFAPLSIHELFRFYGSGYMINLEERGIALDRIISAKFNAYHQTKHMSIRRKFSPMLSYISVQVSHRMGPWIKHHWHLTGSTFSTHKISLEMDSQTDQMLCLPFIYQLLSLKPTLKQWFIMENIFIVFLVYWKIQFLYHNQELSVIDEFRTSQILEKKAKAMMWISEVLSHMFVPDFLALVAAEKVRSTEENDSRKTKPRGTRSQSAIGRLFEYLAGITAKTGTKSQRVGVTSDDVNRKRRIFSELLKLWQADCHNGFPIQAETKNSIGVVLPLIAGQRRLEDSNRPFWENWCSATIDISLQGQSFARELRMPSPAFKKRDFIRVGKRLFGVELDAAARQRLIEFEGAALNQPDEICSNTMDFVLKLIPDLPINQPSELNIPEVFDYFLRYDRFHSATPSYLPNQLKTFFHLKKAIGADSQFWGHFRVHQRYLKRCRRKYQRKIKEANLERNVHESG